MFTSPWAPSIDIEKRHLEITRVMGPWPLDENKKVGRVLMYLLANIIFLSTDFVDVANKENVNKAQQMYVMMLQRYLRHKYKDGDSRFLQGIMISSLAREAAEMRAQRLPV